MLIIKCSIPAIHAKQKNAKEFINNLVAGFKTQSPLASAVTK